MKLVVYILCAALAVANVNAAPPELRLVPTTLVPIAGDQVRVTAKTDTGVTVKWTVIGDWQHTYDTDGKSIIVVCKSARFDILAITVNEKSELSEFVTLTFNGGTSPFPPGPPGPTPTPIVTPAKLRIVIVEETADATAGRGAMFADLKLSARMKERGHSWRVVDQNVTGPDRKTPPADVVEFLDASKGKALPQIYLVDEAGTTRYKGDWGKKTAAELILLLSQWGG